MGWRLRLSQRLDLNSDLDGACRFLPLVAWVSKHPLYSHGPPWLSTSAVKVTCLPHLSAYPFGSQSL